MTTTIHGELLARPSLPSLSRLIQTIGEVRAARRDRSRIVRELNTYTDVELRDMGLFRSDIWAVANGTYRR